METCFQGDLQQWVHPTGIHSIDSLSSSTITEVAAIYIGSGAPERGYPGKKCQQLLTLGTQA